VGFRGLTFDMSGSLKRAQRALGCPLDGRVRGSLSERAFLNLIEDRNRNVRRLFRESVQLLSQDSYIVALLRCASARKKDLKLSANCSIAGGEGSMPLGPFGVFEEGLKA